MHLVAIGGSDAGVSAGLRARELDPGVEVTLVVADAFPNFSVCGLPYFLSGEVPDWRDLAHRSVNELEFAGLRLILDHRATAVDPVAKRVQASGPGGQDINLAYDRLIIATGTAPVRPPIEGTERPGVFFLHTVGDSRAVQRHLLHRSTGSAVIVGGGDIGVEMADALTVRGLSVTLVQQRPHVLASVDGALARLAEDEMGRRGVKVVTGTPVRAIEGDGAGLVVYGDDGFHQRGDVVIIGAGVRPEPALATSAGVATGVRGAIAVDRRMATNLPEVWAAGDCVHTYHRVLDAPSYLPLGTTAHKQGRVAGENAVGGDRRFAGSVGTQVVKVFDLAVARTGLLDGQARDGGFDPLTVASTSLDHKAYYPGPHELAMRVTGDRRTGRLLGMQMLGHRQAKWPSASTSPPRRCSTA